MKRLFLYVILLFVLSCNSGETKNVTVDSVINIPNTSTKYITEYLELEQNSVVLELTRREKLDSIYLLTEKIKPAKVKEEPIKDTERKDEIEFLPDKEIEYSKEFEDSPPIDTLKVISLLENLKNELSKISADSMNIANKIKSILINVSLNEIAAYKTAQLRKANAESIDSKQKESKEPKISGVYIGQNNFGLRTTMRLTTDEHFTIISIAPSSLDGAVSTGRWRSIYGTTNYIEIFITNDYGGESKLGNAIITEEGLQIIGANFYRRQ